jgi:NAD(P)-dependent dehydrogenase (short-subunit alcohol dehydrogenase family)
MDLDIAGLRVLVTAGASGIGLATARAFAREGAKVLICDVDRVALDAVATSDAGLAQTVCDVADPAAVVRLFGVVAARLGGLDALVNNAGIAGPTAACEDIALADWERTLAVNLTGQFLCAQRAIPLLKASRNASIANLSSAAGRFGFRCAHLMRRRNGCDRAHEVVVDRARHLRHPRHRDRPGPVAGARIDAVFANKAAARGVSPQVVRDEALAKTSLGRLVSADDIANAIVFLASPRGANISGHALPVDGDTQSLA